MKYYRKAFTLVESLVSALVIGLLSVSAVTMIGNYYKTTYYSDTANKKLLENISIIEKMRAEVHTVDELERFENDVRIIEVGLGDESLAFSPELKSTGKVYKIIAGDNTKNTNITTILYIGGDSH